MKGGVRSFRLSYLLSFNFSSKHLTAYKKALSLAKKTMTADILTTNKKTNI
jgi:hypothetical protein